MTRILFVGDLHGDLTAACQAVDRAVEHDVDVIMQAGDFGYWTHTRHGTQYLIELQRYLDKNGQVLYFVDGNHENFDHLEEIPLTPSGLRMVKDNIIHIPRGKVLEWDGTKIMGFGGAVSIDGPRGAAWWSQARGPRNGTDLGHWWPQEEITQSQVDSIEEQQVDILLTHDCPLGVQIPGIYRTFPEGQASRELMSQVVSKTKPKLLVHGHYHTRYQSRLNDTKIVGLGSNFDSLNNLTYLIDTKDNE